MLSSTKFKTLNSQLNKEVADFEHAQRVGAHRLGGSIGEVYEPGTPTPELEAEARSYRLGGSSAVSSLDTREERRRRALEAAVARLQREEEELEQSCGTAAAAPAPDASQRSSEDSVV